MEVKYCEICNEYNSGYNFVVRISDDRNKKDFNGHEKCVDRVLEQVRELPYQKMSLDKILSQIKF